MRLTGFTQRAQLGLILVLLTALLAIGQPWSFELYETAIAVLMVTGLAQIAVGNIPPAATLLRFVVLFVVYGAVIVALFVLSIWLAPILVRLGR